jgi:tetratricopeptide (TPR) repeat protein
MRAFWRFLPAVAVVFTAATAHAAEGVVQAPFEATDEGGSLRLSTGLLRVSLSTYRRYQRVLEDLEVGDTVRYSTDEGGQLRTIEEVVDSVAPTREILPVIGKYQGLEKDRSQDFYWLRVDGKRYQVSSEVYQAESKDLLFLDPGDRIRIEIRQNWVVSVDKNVADVAINEEIRKLIEASEKPDTVYVNGNEFRFLRKGEDQITLNPRLPDGSISSGTVQFKLRDITSYRNDAAVGRMRAGGNAGGGQQGDVLDAEGVRVGDTIGIELTDGQVTDLSADSVTLKVWKNERWVADQTWSRSDVSLIRRIRLTTQHSVPLGSGHVQVTVHRWRNASSTGLGFQVEVSHDLDSSLLVGVKLKLHLGGVAMAVTDPAISIEEVEVPNLFANDIVVVDHMVAADDFHDGRVELVASTANALSIESKAAKPHIIAAVGRAGSNSDRLGQVYLAAGKNGDESLLKLLIDRAAYPPGQEPGVKLRNADLAIAALRQDPNGASNLLIKQLYYMDRALKRTVVGGESLREETLNRFNIEPLEHKRRLARLLGKLPGGLTGRNGERLFDIYLARANLGLAIEEAFGERPGEAVKTLLSVATSLHSASSGDEEMRATRATQLLQRLGDSVVDPLMGELRSRGIDVSQLQAYRETAGVPASDVIQRALAFLIEHANEQRRAKLNREVDEAQLKEAEGEWEEALTALRGVLRFEPQHERALERLPGVLLEVADARRKGGERGDAARALEEALTVLPPGQAGRAKTPLAQIYLEAIAEETDGVVIRSTPHRAGSKLKLGQQGQTFPGLEVDNEWIELELGEEKKGYVRAKLVTLGNGSYGIAANETSYAKVIKPLLEEIRTLAPTQKARADELEGELILREAMKRYDNAEYQKAVSLFEEARELVPGDDRLSMSKWAWLHANTVYLAGGLGVLVLAGLIGAMQLFARPKKVKFEGEFRHYGADRAERERGLDLDAGGEGESM